MKATHFLAAALIAVTPLAKSQSLTFAEVTATGTKALSAAEVKELVIGSKTEFTLVNGTVRYWTNAPDGTFIASRSHGDYSKRTGKGTWSVNEDSALCLNFDWGSMDTESFCRRLYKVEGSYYAFGLKAKPDTRSGKYSFSR